MRVVSARVWQAGFVFTLCTPFAGIDAQVAIQVKSGTTWTSNLEVSVRGPITFRWRWDGAESPTGVAWQVATVAPTSTATSRTQDVIAGETGLRVPAAGGTKGAYEEFTVNPAATWPATFYVRVRVNTGRTSSYSRWIPVSTAERAPVAAASLNCAVEGWLQDVAAFWVWSRPKLVAPGGTVSVTPFDNVWVNVLVRNTSRNVASYKRRIRIEHEGFDVSESKTAGPWSVAKAADESQVRTIAAGKTDTVTIGASSSFERLFLDSGKWVVYMNVASTDQPVITCSGAFTTVK